MTYAINYFLLTCLLVDALVAFSALTMLVGRQEEHPACKNGGWWRWALVSPDGVARSRTICASASVNLPLHHKVHKFSSGTGSSGWSRKKGRKTVVVVVVTCLLTYLDITAPLNLYIAAVNEHGWLRRRASTGGCTVWTHSIGQVTGSVSGRRRLQRTTTDVGVRHRRTPPRQLIDPYRHELHPASDTFAGGCQLII